MEKEISSKGGSLGHACEFAVGDLDLRLLGDSVSMGSDWKVSFGSENMGVIPVYLWNSADSYGRHPIFVTEEQRKAGSLTIPAGLLKNPAPCKSGSSVNTRWDA
jgi:hypothetical protein